MTARSFISLRERPLFKAHARPFLEHGALYHFDTLKAFEFECCKGWFVLDDGYTILIREDCKVVFCAQVRLILRSLLIACECVVFHTQVQQALVLEVAYRHNHIHLCEVCVGNDELSWIKAALTLTSVKVISGWERRKHRISCVGGCCRRVHSDLVVGCCRRVHSGFVVSVGCSHVYILWMGV